MYLKSIEVQGFKSFAQKICFEFHNGITGIVGPNGSGKSNVYDAVRWVLGEQKTKQLRSSSMQDVIFAGSANRRPLSYAYVALTLDNSDHELDIDYEEVTVARKLYRSGESDYIINGHSCRLRDVQELFYDTGIGKEGYSLIGQGQIERILSGKPEERRALLDEAAGIVKYKRRRNEALKKLSEEEQSLSRVNDIISELERQIGPLQKQSETARIYLKKRDILKEYDINLFLLQSGEVSEQVKDLDSKIRIASDQKAEAQEKLSKISSAYDEACEKEQALTAQTEAERGQISEAELERERTDNHISLLREQIRGIEQNAVQAQERMAWIRHDIEDHQQQLALKEEEIVTLEEEIRAIADKKTAMQEEQDARQAELSGRAARLEEARQEHLALLNRRADVKAAQERGRTMLEQAQIRKASLQASLFLARGKEEEAAGRLTNEQKNVEAVTEEIDALRAQEDELLAKRDEWSDKAKEASDRLGHLKDEISRLTSKRDSLQAIAERYEGYGGSIRRVMEQKAETPGLIGVVADLIRTDRRYETAIETALGGSIQNIVTEDEATAKQMIAFLKKHHYGRATFLPISSVKMPKNLPSEKILKEEGVLGFADRLIETDEKYRGICGHLLARTVVCDQIDHALALAAKYRYSLRIVTLEGELLTPGGALSGGAFKNSSNLLSRKREIEALNAQIDKAKEQAEDCMRRLKEIETADLLLKDDQNDLQQKLQEKLLEQNTAKLRLEQEQQARAQNARDYEEQKRQIGEVEEEIAQIRQTGQENEEGLSSLDAQEEELNASIEERIAENEHLEQLIREAEDAIARIRLEEASLIQNRSFLEENRDRLQTELSGQASEYKRIETESAKSGERISKRQEEIRRDEERLINLEERAGALREALAQTTAAARALQEKTREQVRLKEELLGETAELEKEIMRLQMRHDNLTGELKSLTEYIWTEYELTLHNAKEYRREEYTSVPDLKKRIRTVKAEIKELGPVNVNAVEEYKEVSERYDFMSAQRDDLVKANEALEKIIADLNEGMRRQFSENFEQINHEFDSVFKELFGGGHGSLVLTEEEDVLESGIAVIAQPPGKKLQNMMQLSGGEKALTAIALLFAIQNLKPSPFCLLDEIEAALDESNVDRFARYLHKLTEHTQFIVITHRRTTMSSCDRLYGITMQEKGVSALVSVNLIEESLDD